MFISSLICRQHGFYNKRVADVNSILQIICWENGLGFIDNSNIGVEKLADGLHLNYMGTKDLANNYIYCLNKFVLWNDKVYNGSISFSTENNDINVNINQDETQQSFECIDNHSDSLCRLDNLKLCHPNKVIIGNLNINSISIKFEQVKDLILTNIDILVVTETKVDDTFPVGHFFVKGFSTPYRIDRNRHGGGIMIFVKDDIPSRVLNKHLNF